DEKDSEIGIRGYFARSRVRERNSMLEKNLEALEKMYPKLAEELREIEVSDKVELFLGEDDQINMAWQDIALHSIDDPIGEAKAVCEAGVDTAFRDRESVIFIYGLGLGYLLRRAYVSSTSMIIVFEPHMDVLKRTLEVVDFSEEFNSKRVLIVADINKIT